MTKIINPVLKGFNPDPSIVRVGDDYYIATSTFEWFPGVQIHHSKDMVNWRLLGRVLDDERLVDLTGVENSAGVYAPALSYSDGKFWLAFSNVRACRGGSWMSTPCYLTWAESIEGPWETPVSINAIGFDPSLFHDDDGKKYIVNMIWDGRHNRNFFGGIAIQEFCVKQRKPIGKITKIFEGTKEFGCTEGPQILKKDGYYYLITAEGGTGFYHAVTVCRSKALLGPYEIHPNNPILTSRFKPEAPLQRTGHGFFVETQKGEWYMTHLCGRVVDDPDGYNFTPEFGRGYSLLGRESAIQKVLWREGWPWLANGTNTADLEVEAPNLPPHPWPTEKLRDDFNEPTLNKHFQSLRKPFEESWCSLTERKGCLRLKGQHYLYSNYEQSMVARRVQSFRFMAETCVDFQPDYIQQLAGLIVYYNKGNHYFLRISANDEGLRTLQIVQYIDNNYGEPVEELELPDGLIYMRVALKELRYQFSWSTDGEHWKLIGRPLNAVCLSDEYGADIFKFTGTFVGLFVADVTGEGKSADFDYFDYQELD